MLDPNQLFLSPERNAAITHWLIKNSSDPGMAIDLWAGMLTGLHDCTGEMQLSVDDLAAKVDAVSDAVSEVLADLEEIGVVSRKRLKTGRLAVFINPWVATILPEDARNKAQAEIDDITIDNPIYR